LDSTGHNFKMIRHLLKWFHYFVVVKTVKIEANLKITIPWSIYFGHHIIYFVFMGL